MEDTARSENKRPATRRYGKRGRRRGRYGYAAPLGVAVTLLSLVGVAALLIAGIGAAQRAASTEGLKTEMYYFLEPVLVYNPQPFDNIAEVEQDAFLNAAAYRVSLAEQIRMLRERDENCRYAADDNGRIAVPLEEIEEAYNALFGSESPLTHRSVEDSDLTFSDVDNCYYVPFESASTGYVPVVDTVRRHGDAYLVRVGFVANNDVLIDEHGNEVPPTASMAAYYQTYTLKKSADGYYITACSNQ